MALESAQTTPVSPTRTDKFVWGIPQNGLQQKEREVSTEEPPPLPANAELTYIGKATERYDGPAKAMGTGKYTADVNLPGMLYARMVDATIPHGRIVSIDTTAAEKLPGVRAVHVIEHVYGVGNSFAVSGHPLRRSADCRSGRCFTTDSERCRKAG